MGSFSDMKDSNKFYITKTVIKQNNITTCGLLTIVAMLQWLRLALITSMLGETFPETARELPTRPE